MHRNRLEPSTLSRKGLHIGTRVLLFAAVVVFVLQILLYMVGGQNNLCVYFWLYPLLFALNIVLVVALIIPGARRISKSVMARKLLTTLACIVTGFVAIMGWSMVWTFYNIGNQPIAYYTSPGGGHRLVIMRHYDIEKSIEDPASIYEAYPMVNAMYYAYQENGQLSSADRVEGPLDSISAPTHSQNLPVAVEWLDDTHARVYWADASAPNEADEIHVYFDP